MLTLLALVACHSTPSIAGLEPPENARTCDDVDASQWELESAAVFVPIDTQRAVFHGVVGANTPDRFAQLMTAMPDLQTLIMTYGPGSRNDEAMLELSYAVREAGLDTCIPPGGIVASGATDLFVAGTERHVGTDAQVGVHSWAGGSFEGADLARDHAEHRPYIDYYEAMGLPDPEGFYFFTLEAAPADGIHWMTDAELVQWGLVQE